MSSEEEKMQIFLSEIQLDQFYYLLVKNLHLTRISHFAHVEEVDLTGIGMSKPEQRRLFEHLKKHKKPSIKKFFKKSFKRDNDKRVTSPPPNDNPELHKEDQTMVIARNNIRQGLKCLISERDIVLGEFLGKGAFGYVRKGLWTTDKGSEVNVAVKSLKPSHDEASVMLQNEFINEANAMSKLDHPNLVRLYGIVLTAPMMLVTELAPLGSLLGRLRQEPEKFMISILCSFVVQIVSGMKYLESNRFIHRDLAARNILLVSYEKIKIGDFGLMRALPSDADYYVMQPTGLVPFAWCATECLKYRRFSHASDVWAFGVTVLELFSYGREPWPGMNGAEILERIDAPNFQRPDRPSHCPIAIYKIIRNCCWCDDPEQRKSFEVLEKMILEVLPKEITTSCSYNAVGSHEVSFEIGDTLTLVEAYDAENVKAQNRRTGQVGYVPVSLVSKSTGGKANDDLKFSPVNVQSPKTLSLVALKKEKLLETDCLSVASRGSSSSSASDSSSSSAKYLSSHNAIHSNPRDIPKRRQGSLSSGYGSGGPSYSNSLKDDSLSRGGSEFDSFAEEPNRNSSSSVCGRIEEDDVSLMADERAATISLCSYENVNKEFDKTQSETTDVPSFPKHEASIRHSSPVAISSRRNSTAASNSPGHFDAASSSSLPGDELVGSPTNVNIVNFQYIVSLPVNTTENENLLLDTSNESEADVNLSNSAPTTRSEMKAISKAKRKQQRNSTIDTTVTAHRSSFGSYREKWLPQVHQMIDKSVYECMAMSDEKFEMYEQMNDDFMEDNSKGPKSEMGLNLNTSTPTQTADACYENTRIEYDDTACYENTTIPFDKLRSVPPIPPKTHRNISQRNSEANRPTLCHSLDECSDLFRGSSPVEAARLLPARSYRTSRHGSIDSWSSDVYENYGPRQLATSPVPPRTYKNATQENFPSAMLRNERSFYSGDGEKRSNKNFAVPLKTYPKSNLSYENTEIAPPAVVRSKSNNIFYENHELAGEMPPPLPRKRSQKTMPSVRNIASPLVREIMQPHSGESAEFLIDVAAIASCHEYGGKTEGKDERLDLGSSALSSSKPCNLIDDSPIQDNLALKYGTVWDGKELLVEEVSKACIDFETEVEDESNVSIDKNLTKKTTKEEVKDDECRSSEKSSSLKEVKYDEDKVLVKSHIKEVKARESAKETLEDSKELDSHSVSLLRALLSPKEQFTRKLSRSSSEDSPVPPPRKYRDKRKEPRRHTVSGSPPKTRHDFDLQCNEPIKCVLPRGSAIEKYPSVVAKADAPLQFDSGQPPLPPGDSVDDVKERQESSVVSAEPRSGETQSSAESTDISAIAEETINYDTTGKDELKCLCPDIGLQKTEDGEISKSLASSVHAEPKKIRIKSLLSENVTDAHEKDVEILKTSSKEENSNVHAETDDIRYVLHFVTPV